MDFTKFRAILASFADDPGDIDISKGKLCAQIRDELIDIELVQENGDVFVRENEETLEAANWITRRIARLDLLADRILTNVKQEAFYVPQKGRFLGHLEDSPGGEAQRIEGVEAVLRESLDRRVPGMCSILYLTSDAGEGKTTTINYAARKQAREFKNRNSNWLMVPIPLGGRTMMRFDDVVVGALVNKLRFQLLYYDAFLHLVRMGVLVPAFDGFEEMFVEGSGGEAITSLGVLIQQLNGQGNVLIATRKAFFEYSSLETQARLLDGIPNKEDHDFSFAKLEISRWEKAEFVEYCNKRSYPNPGRLYDSVATALETTNHPVLTRPVLARRLLDIATDFSSDDELLTILKPETGDFFDTFIHTILEREVNEKWIDKSAEPLRPLLTADQHHELLGRISEEMWVSKSDSLKKDVFDLISEIYSEQSSLTVQQSRQVKERLTQHALIIPSQNAGSYCFDHDEFRNYFLGCVVANIAAQRSVPELRRILRPAPLPILALDAAARHIENSGVDCVDLFISASNEEGMTSFCKENCGAIIIRLLDNKDGGGIRLSRLNFPDGALNPRKLSNLVFSECYFQPTKLSPDDIRNSVFEDCEFERLDFSGTAMFEDVSVLPSDRVRAVSLLDADLVQYDPDVIKTNLTKLGIKILEDPDASRQGEDTTQDKRTEILQRALRCFVRTSGVNENVFLQRLGVHSSEFFKEMLPDLEKYHVIGETNFRGAGHQRRFRLLQPLSSIENAIAQSGGSFQNFLSKIDAS